MLIPWLPKRSILCSCAITVAEYFAGETRGMFPVRDAFVDSLVYLESPPEVAELAGNYRRSFARRGIELSTQDTLIAAVASHHGATLVTRNFKDFPMDDVRLMRLAG
jgi:predicted nucleic acid-binding protein